MQRTQTAPYRKVTSTTTEPSAFCGFNVEKVYLTLACGHSSKPLTRFRNVPLQIPKKRRCTECAREKVEAAIQRSGNYAMGGDYEWVGERDIYEDLRQAEGAAS